MNANQTPKIKTEHTKNPPIIVDLGKRKKKDIKQLQNGGGKLLDEVTECIQELIVSGSCSAEAQPIVLIVREKPKGGLMLFSK
jgi:hypothetical protein